MERYYCAHIFKGASRRLDATGRVAREHDAREEARELLRLFEASPAPEESRSGMAETAGTAIR